jgi:hypothetical protein
MFYRRRTDPRILVYHTSGTLQKYLRFDGPIEFSSLNSVTIAQYYHTCSRIPAGLFTLQIHVGLMLVWTDRMMMMMIMNRLVLIET